MATDTNNTKIEIVLTPEEVENAKRGVAIADDIERVMAELELAGWGEALDIKTRREELQKKKKTLQATVAVYGAKLRKQNK